MGQNTDRDVPFEFEKRHRNFEILQIIRLDLSQEKNGNYCVYEVLISAICDLTISLKQIQLFTRHVSKWEYKSRCHYFLALQSLS